MYGHWDAWNCEVKFSSFIVGCIEASWYDASIYYSPRGNNQVGSKESRENKNKGTGRIKRSVAFDVCSGDWRYDMDENETKRDCSIFGKVFVDLRDVLVKPRKMPGN